MTEEYTEKSQKPTPTKMDKPQVGLIIRVARWITSAIVGISSFFVIKLLFMAPINIMMTPESADLLNGIGALLVLFSIYLATRLTKHINSIGPKKSRVIWRVATIILGFFAMLLSNILLMLPGKA